MDNTIDKNDVVINNRNYTMDIFKAIFAIGVILVHFPYPGTFGKIMTTIGICGVIFFFLISGYYAYNIDDDIACQNIKRRFKRNLILTIIVILIYFFVIFLERIIAGEFKEFMNNFTNPWLFPRMLLLGDFSFINCDAIWFMNNLLISYLVLYILHKFKITKYAYFALPVLLLGRIAVEIYVNTYDADWHFTSFFLTSGLPIILLGHFIASHKDLFYKTPIFVDLILFIVSTTIMFLTVFYKIWGFNIAQIFKIWCIFELFIITIKIPGKREIPIIGTIGRKYSMYIYLFHLLIGVITYDIVYLIDSPEWVYVWLAPALVIIFSIIISIIIYEIKNLITKRKEAH